MLTLSPQPDPPPLGSMAASSCRSARWGGAGNKRPPQPRSQDGSLPLQPRAGSGRQGGGPARGEKLEILRVRRGRVLVHLCSLTGGSRGRAGSCRGGGQGLFQSGGLGRRGSGIGCGWVRGVRSGKTLASKVPAHETRLQVLSSQAHRSPGWPHPHVSPNSSSTDP